MCASARNAGNGARLEFAAVKERFLEELDYIKRNIARDATKNQAVGRLRRLIREVRVVEAGGLDLLLSKNWGQVMDEVDISEAKWGVADVEGAIKALRSPMVRPPQLNLKLKTTLRSGNLVLRSSRAGDRLPGTHALSHRPDPAGARRVRRADRPQRHRQDDLSAHADGHRSSRCRANSSLAPRSRSATSPRRTRGSTPNNTVLDELLRHKQMLLGPARNYLAQYLFRGDDVYKPVRALSGGERGRLALALLALEGANFLLLDEPSNHLDIPAQEVLQEVLEQFDGTILLVSHDRYLIDRLATQVWELRDGVLHVFPGTYAEMLAARERALERSQAGSGAGAGCHAQRLCHQQAGARGGPQAQPGRGRRRKPRARPGGAAGAVGAGSPRRHRRPGRGGDRAAGPALCGDAERARRGDGNVDGLADGQAASASRVRTLAVGPAMQCNDSSRLGDGHGK